MNEQIKAARKNLLQRFDALDQNSKRAILSDPEMGKLYAMIPQLPQDERAAFGQAVNSLKNELQAMVEDNEAQQHAAAKPPIDVTAPFDVNTTAPEMLPSINGSIHPISTEIDYMSDILQRMGFQVYGSREIDDQYHMFEALNFPKGHPARDDYDTFMTVERDGDGDPLIAPAHTSTMQNRIMRELKGNLERGEPIAATSIDRVFRNEDLDPRHEHTFYQHEGIFVDKDVTVGMLVATLKSFLEGYFVRPIDARINPFYFPFTEPSFEFSLGCPFCDKAGCSICGQVGWIELLGCGMIHPNVLRAAEIDPEVYSGFAWGGGVERLIMMKHNIEDIRHFESGKLDFLKQF